LDEIGKRARAALEKVQAASIVDVEEKVVAKEEVVSLVEELRTIIVYYQVSAGHVV
jgi:hypothetical protein